ncbi:MAG: pyridoxal-phosphate dependent enzyme, partial [Desulfosarcina sp.]
AGAITFETCRSLVDDWILVTEAEIRGAMRRIFENHRLVIEGAAGVAVAGFLKMARRLHGQTVVVVLCGGNVDVGLFKTLVCASVSSS